ELPVRIAITRFLADRSAHHTPRYDREGLAAWASERFHTIIDPEEIRPMLRPEIEKLLLDLAHQHYQGARLADELDRHLEAVYPPSNARDKQALPAADSAALESLASWAQQDLGLELTGEQLGQQSHADLRALLLNALDAKHRAEMRE